MKPAAQRQPPAPDNSPCAIDVERSVLGSILLQPEMYYEAAAVGLTPPYFHLTSHVAIYAAISRLATASTPIDMVTLVDQLIVMKSLEAVGGVAYVSGLIDGVPDRPSIRPYIEILHEKYLRRRLLHLTASAMNSATDMSDPADFTIARLQDDLLRLQGGIARDGYEIAEFDQEVLAKIKKQREQESEIVGLPFGIAELDARTTGAREGEFVVVGGLPGSGKTAFGGNVARVNAEHGTRVGIFSIEMRKHELLHRLWAQSSDIPYKMLRNPKELDSVSLMELEQHWMPRVRALPIKIDDTAKDIQEIIPRAHLWVQRFKIELIVVDFLQRIHAPGRTEYDIVSYSADALTEFAKATGVPVLALSQLTRPEDKKNAANSVPNMTMLRASGKIEQNANLIIFTHRPEGDDGQPNGEDLLIIGKQRGGVKGRIKAFFDGNSQRWEARP